MIFAYGDSTIHSQYYIKLEEEKCSVVFNEYVLNIWYDDYNWHNSKSVYIPFEGSVSDRLGNILIDEGLGRSFGVNTKWKEEVQGKYEKSFLSGELTINIKKNGTHNYELHELKQKNI